MSVNGCGKFGVARLSGLQLIICALQGRNRHRIFMTLQQNVAKRIGDRGVDGVGFARPLR